MWSGDVGGRVDQDEAFLREVVGEDGEERGAAAVVAQLAVPEVDGAPVGQLAEEAEGVVHARLGDAADHHRLGDAEPAREAQPAAELHDARLFEVVAQRGQLGHELVAQADARNTAAGRADAPRDDDGKLSLARDQSDRSGVGAVRVRRSPGHRFVFGPIGRKRSGSACTGAAACCSSQSTSGASSVPKCRISHTASRTNFSFTEWSISALSGR